MILYRAVPVPLLVVKKIISQERQHYVRITFFMFSVTSSSVSDTGTYWIGTVFDGPLYPEIGKSTREYYSSQL